MADQAVGGVDRLIDEQMPGRPPIRNQNSGATTPSQKLSARLSIAARATPASSSAAVSRPTIIDTACRAPSRSPRSQAFGDRAEHDRTGCAGRARAMRAAAVAEPAPARPHRARAARLPHAGRADQERSTVATPSRRARRWGDGKGGSSAVSHPSMSRANSPTGWPMRAMERAAASPRRRPASMPPAPPAQPSAERRVQPRQRRAVGGQGRCVADMDLPSKGRVRIDRCASRSNSVMASSVRDQAEQRAGPEGADSPCRIEGAIERLGVADQPHRGSRRSMRGRDRRRCRWRWRRRTPAMRRAALAGATPARAGRSGSRAARPPDAECCFRQK
jgi:hypothetical protein